MRTGGLDKGNGRQTSMDEIKTSGNTEENKSGKMRQRDK